MSRFGGISEMEGLDKASPDQIICYKKLQLGKMSFFRKARASAFRARLQLAKDERRRIVELVTKSQVNLARIADRMDRVEDEIRALTRELKLLEMPDPEDVQDGSEAAVGQR